MNITVERKSNILTPEEVQLLEKNLEHLSAEYHEFGTLSLDSLALIIGRPPIIPDTHDLDSKDIAWEETALYGKKVCKIEELVRRSLN